MHPALLPPILLPLNILPMSPDTQPETSIGGSRGCESELRFKAASPWGTLTHMPVQQLDLLAPAGPPPAFLARPWVSPLGIHLREVGCALHATGSTPPTRRIYSATAWSTQHISGGEPTQEGRLTGFVGLL